MFAYGADSSGTSYGNSINDKGKNTIDFAREKGLLAFVAFMEAKIEESRLLKQTYANTIDYFS